MVGKDNVQGKKSSLVLKVSIVMMFFVTLFVLGMAYTIYLDYTKNKSESHAIAEVISQNENYLYQTEVTKLMEDLVDYTKKVYDPILLKQVTNSNRENLLNISIDFRDKVEKFNPKPLTDRDRQFESLVYDLKSQSDDLVYYAIKYINEGDITSKSLFIESYNELSVTLKSIALLEDKLY